jgi:hypothetical protein
MASVSRLGRQIEEVVATLNAMGAQFALIGGLALASHKVIRATQDVDLLTDVDIADQIDTAFTKLGYRCAHRSSEAANYLRGDERLDFLFASRPIARRLLTDAVKHTTLFGVLRVISTEGLIALMPPQITIGFAGADRRRGRCCDYSARRTRTVRSA